MCCLFSDESSVDYVEACWEFAEVGCCVVGSYAYALEVVDGCFEWLGVGCEGMDGVVDGLVVGCVLHLDVGDSHELQHLFCVACSEDSVAFCEEVEMVGVAFAVL